MTFHCHPRPDRGPNIQRKRLTIGQPSFIMLMIDQQQQFAWQNALIAVAAKPRTMIAANA